MTTQTIISNSECRKSTGFKYGCLQSNKTTTDNTTGTKIITITNTIVPEEISYENRIVDGMMMCAVNEGRGQCQGDSGGPFTLEENGKHILIGVTSFGMGCAKVYKMYKFCYGSIFKHIFIGWPPRCQGQHCFLQRLD